MSGVGATGSSQPGPAPAVLPDNHALGNPLKDSRSATFGGPCESMLTSPAFGSPRSDAEPPELPESSGSPSPEPRRIGSISSQAVFQQTPPKHVASPEGATQDEASPSWTEKSPLRALWKWGSGMSASEMADLAEEISCLEMGCISEAAPGAGGGNRLPSLKTAPRSSLRHSSSSPIRSMPPLQVRLHFRRQASR